MFSTFDLSRRQFGCCGVVDGRYIAAENYRVVFAARNGKRLAVSKAVGVDCAQTYRDFVAGNIDVEERRAHRSVNAGSVESKTARKSELIGFVVVGNGFLVVALIETCSFAAETRVAVGVAAARSAARQDFLIGFADCSYVAAKCELIAVGGDSESFAVVVAGEDCGIADSNCLVSGISADRQSSCKLFSSQGIVESKGTADREHVRLIIVVESVGAVRQIALHGFAGCNTHARVRSRCNCGKFLDVSGIGNHAALQITCKVDCVSFIGSRD